MEHESKTIYAKISVFLLTYSFWNMLSWFSVSSLAHHMIQIVVQLDLG